MSRFRVPGKGRVDVSRPVTFTFDGKSYQSAQGDTVASALLANGVHLMGRSFIRVETRAATVSITARAGPPVAARPQARAARCPNVSDSGQRAAESRRSALVPTNGRCLHPPGGWPSC